MRHLLFKIYGRNISWKKAQYYTSTNSPRRTMYNINGMSTVRLTSKDLRDLAKFMDAVGINDFRILKMENDGMYLIIE